MDSVWFSRCAAAATVLLAAGSGGATTAQTAMPRERPVASGRPELVHAFRGRMPVGVAISADAERLFYTPLASRRLYSVATDALVDADGAQAQAAATVKGHGEKGVADGMCEDTRNRICTTDWERSATILRRLPNGLFDTVAHDAGRDRRVRPSALWRIKTDARPVDLR